MRLVGLIARWRYAVVAAAFLLFALVGSQDNGDLEYFTQALHVLGQGGSQGNIHLYAVRPDIQIGPLAVLGTGLLDLLFGGKIVFAVVVGALALLLLLLRAVEGLAHDAGHDPARTGLALAVGGSALAAAWAVVVPGWGHLDDLGALVAMVAALRAARAGQAVPAGLFLALALGCKPWAAFAVGVLIFLPRDRRKAGLAAFLGAGLVIWAPFVLGAPETLPALAHFSLKAIYGSLPRQLGYATAPSWVRPGQLVLACVLSWVCWRARRPDLVILVVAVSRLLLDAGVFPYYDAELVVGCLVADVLAAGGGRRLIRATAPLTVLAWLLITVIHDGPLSSAQAFAARCGLYVVLIGLAVARRPDRVTTPDTRSTRRVERPTPQPTGSHARSEGGPVGRPRALTAGRQHAP